mmetsp:Transcript_63283/g.95498  ORF Transcript_63283/g.95498 Transcript_63283/m.95498 type:complete len:253 (+) Transcript_63283:2191-2949(+)
MRVEHKGIERVRTVRIGNGSSAGSGVAGRSIVVEKNINFFWRRQLPIHMFFETDQQGKLLVVTGFRWGGLVVTLFCDLPWSQSSRAKRCFFIRFYRIVYEGTVWKNARCQSQGFWIALSNFQTRRFEFTMGGLLCVYEVIELIVNHGIAGAIRPPCISFVAIQKELGGVASIWLFVYAWLGGSRCCFNPRGCEEPTQRWQYKLDSHGGELVSFLYLYDKSLSPSPIQVIKMSLKVKVGLTLCLVAIVFVLAL